ncbi:MAG: hypothetical protein MJ131_04890 [Lachnospiraceae bacterium]|nr:hypothetical protein [Lachnospiraceae bacterium]
MIHIFILNPCAGRQNFSEELRKKLESFEKLNYYIFNTRNSGHETELVRKILKIFSDESIRIYCCGGSGTMCNIMNGIDDFSSVELAFYPCGLTNDFLKVFEDDYDKFRNIENLINGEVILIDYIKTNHGVALNTFSVGLDSNLTENLIDYRFMSVFGKGLPYLMAFLNATFFTKPDNYEIYVDEQKFEGSMSQLCFGNGNYIGGIMNMTDDANIWDGKASYLIGPPKGGARLLPLVNHMIKRRIDKLRAVTTNGKCEQLTIKRIDGQPFQINLDGEMQPAQKEWTARIINKGLKFVIPKGVNVIDR